MEPSVIMIRKFWSIRNIYSILNRTLKTIYWLTVLPVILISGKGWSQDQKIADSLAVIYARDELNDTARLELLRHLSFNESRNLQLGLQYADELIQLSAASKNYLYLYRGYLQKGNKLRLTGDLEKALDAYFKCAEAARQANYLTGEASAYGVIADIYSVSKNQSNARLYYQKAIDYLRQTTDSIALASAILNAGDDYLNHQIFDSAFLNFKEAESIFSRVNYPIGKAYALGNLGMIYSNQGNHALAEQNINEAIRILEELEDYYPICVYLLSMSDIYREKGDRTVAQSYAQRSLSLAQQYQLKEQISAANLTLSELAELGGEPDAALHFYKGYILYRDSVNDINTVQKLADLRTDFEVAQKQSEVDLLQQEKRNQQIIVSSLIIILALSIILLGTLYWYYRTIAREKKRSESLLLNILPAETALELKQKGHVDAVKFDKVTVLFTDFVEFSKFAESTAPEHLVQSIHFYFKGFDEITTTYGLEKIKTIGDAYMCASGIPSNSASGAREVILAAREMVDFVQKTRENHPEIMPFELRLGAHTGQVVAGIAGIKKWQYDIWGDTVNIASRMESNSTPGRLNLSQTTYEEIKDEFRCTFRGEIEVKNLGLMRMYYLD